MKAGGIVLRVVLFLLIIAAGFALLVWLSSFKPMPDQTASKKTMVTVSVMEANVSNEQMIIPAMGTVIPSRLVNVAPEVGGKVIAQNENLVPGGRLKKGEMIVRLNPRDYDLAMAQQHARVVQAEMELSRERSRKSVAEQEWAMIQSKLELTEEGRKLALHETQLENARAAVKGAQSGLEKAKLSRNRTSLKSPFNALVTEEFVDIGQTVGPSSRVATLVDADTFWVRLSVPMDRLQWISIPGVSEGEGSKVKVIQNVGANKKVIREGYVIKLLGDLDPRGKMARLLVEIKDPLGSNGELPLLLGAYVSVEIQGPQIEQVIKLPRLAVRDNDTVWVKDGSVLRFVNVEIIWSMGDHAFVKGAISDKAEIVINRISAPVEGMSIKLEGETIEDTDTQVDSEQGKDQ